MEFRRPLIFCCVLLLASLAGCRQNHAARELLERELRLQEDRIYQLEAELDDAQRMLEAMQQNRGGGTTMPDRSPLFDRSPASSTEPPKTFLNPPSSLAPPSSTLPPPSSTQPLTPPSKHDLTPPAVELPAPGAAPSSGAPPYQGPPAIMPPRADVPEGKPGSVAPNAVLPSPLTPATPSGGEKPSSPGTFKPMSSPKFLPPSVKSNTVFDAKPSVGPSPLPAAAPASNGLPPSSFPTSGAPAVANNAAAKSDGLRSIAVGRASRGVNLDGKPGDDGVQVVLQGRTVRGEIVAPTGDISLVLIDPAVPGEGGRYARWDFSADDAAALFRAANGEAEAGSYFELPWPDAPPAHTRLKLFVRLTTAGGAQLQIDRELVIDLTGGTTQHGAPAYFSPTTAMSTSAAGFTTVVPTAGQTEQAPEGGLRWGRIEAAAEATAPTSVETPTGPLLYPAEAGLPDTSTQR